MNSTHSGQYGRQSPLSRHEDQNHNVGPLIKDRTFIKSKSSPSNKKSTPPASTHHPARLQPMSNGRVPSPSYNIRGGSPALSSLPTEQAAKPLNLACCYNCGRSFAAERLAKHEVICNKSSHKQRKVFDSSKMRTQGTEAAQFNRHRARKAPDPPKPKSNWRKKHGKEAPLWIFGSASCGVQGSISRRSWKVFAPKKAKQNLKPYDFRAVLCTSSWCKQRFPSYKKFQTYTSLCL